MMKIVYCLLLVFTLTTSCTSSKKSIPEKVNISGEIVTKLGNTPVNSTIELYIEDQFVAKIDSSYNGYYSFDISNNYFNKTGFLVLTNVKLIVEKMEIIPSGYFPCETETDTIPIVLNSYKNRKKIIVGPCDPGKQVNYPSKHY